MPRKPRLRPNALTPLTRSSGETGQRASRPEGCGGVGDGRDAARDAATGYAEDGQGTAKFMNPRAARANHVDRGWRKLARACQAKGTRLRPPSSVASTTCPSGRYGIDDDADEQEEHPHVTARMHKIANWRGSRRVNAPWLPA